MLNDDQIKEAITQVKVHCDILQERYEPVSLRSALNSLGYESEDTQQVIEYVASRGFTYCLDHTIKCSSGVGDTPDEYPSSDVCYWGPDQLKSRLWCVR